MAPFFIKLAAGIWLVWLVSWQVAAFWRAKPSVSMPRKEYRVHFMVIIVGLLLVFGIWPRRGPYLWQVSPVLGWSMIAVTAAGFVFAWWARIHLGNLWSGGIERMAHHRVVDTGPYALARHPIYTGMIAAAAAMAALRATPWAFLGLAGFAVGFVLKAKAEERFLEQELGGYEEYRRRVSMIVPLPRRA